MAGFAVPQVTEGDWTSVKCVDILGVHIPAFFATDPQVLYDFISTFQTRPDDVFVVGFPKSGNVFITVRALHTSFLATQSRYKTVHI